jgi:hypothetical protein
MRTQTSVAPKIIKNLRSSHLLYKRGLVYISDPGAKSRLMPRC